MVAPRAVGVCWGGSGKCVYFCSSPGSCRSEFVALGITNTSLCQLAAGDESDWQHHSMDPSLAVQLRVMPVAKVLVMSPGPVQGESPPSASGLTLLVEVSQYPVGQGVSSDPCCLPGLDHPCPSSGLGGLGWLHELLSAHWQHPRAGCWFCSQKDSLSLCCQKHLLQLFWLTPAGNLSLTQPFSSSHRPQPQWGEESKRKGKLCGLR